jgi:NTP pyrophosphatase (non-canonical NTP hydrolase)
MENKELTIKEFQDYIRDKDINPELKEGYFQKLVEEVGELAKALRKDERLIDGESIKGTVEEELYDVLYYVAALANVYDIDLETCFHLKEELNRKKWGK